MPRLKKMSVKKSKQDQIEFNLGDLSVGQVEEQQLEKEDVFEETVPSMISLINSHREIVIPDKFEFSCVVSWNPLVPFFNEFKFSKKIPIEPSRDWFYNFYVNSLTDRDSASKILSASEEELYEMAEKLDINSLESLAVWCTEKGKIPYESDWDIVCMKVALALFEKLGILLGGRSRKSDSPRLWVGREPSSQSPKVKFQATQEEVFYSIGGRFLETFLGQNLFKKRWSLYYRSGLWKIKSQDKTVFIEEFDYESFED